MDCESLPAHTAENPSDLYVMVTVSASNKHAAVQARVYPNPVQGTLYIEANDPAVHPALLLADEAFNGNGISISRRELYHYSALVCPISQATTWQQQAHRHAGGCGASR